MSQAENPNSTIPTRRALLLRAAGMASAFGALLSCTISVIAAFDPLQTNVM
jgi:hypothetical protein